MAVFAVLWRWLVEQYLFAVDVPEELVAVSTAHVLMGTGQGELGPPLVVEQRRFPLGGIVTVRAGGNPFGLGELAGVDVGMAVLTLGGSFGKVGFDQLGAQVRRLVAIDASHGFVGTGEGELRPVVIEASHVFPVLGGVAGLAADRCTVATQSLHAVGKLVVVRILVAGGAGIVLEVKYRGRVISGRICGIGSFI